MQKPILSINGKKLIAFLEDKMHVGDFTNDDLVQFIEVTGSYLNLKTIPDYSKQEGMSYNGVKKCRNIRKIFNVKFVIENH